MRDCLLLTLLFVSQCTSHKIVISEDQVFQSLSTFNGYVAPEPGFAIKNKVYNPLKITKDAARLWNPIYPRPVLLTHVNVDLSPACQWPEVFDEVTLKSKGYNKTGECPLENETDVSVAISMNYTIYEGTLKEGYKCIGDSPRPTSPVPWVHGVDDGDGSQLNYNMFRDAATKQWWVHYIFAQPASSFYTVKIKYQLRQVLVGEKKGTNKFVANWLQEWDAPVQSMDIHWIFPPAFKPKHFSVEPGNRKSDDGPSQLTALCCGEIEPRELTQCTYDKETALKWAAEHDSVNNCLNSSVILITSLRLAPGIFADNEAGVDLNEVYSVSFSPGLVEQSPLNQKERESYSWILPLLLVLLFPCLGAIFWTLSPSDKAAKLEDHYA